MEKHKQRVINLHHKIIKRIKGFTIIELIIVIAIIGILSTIGVVGYGEVTKQVIVTQIKNDLISAAEAMEIDKAYNRKYPDTLPTDFKHSSDLSFTGPGGSATISLSGGTEYCIEVTNTSRPNIGTFSISSYGSGTEISEGNCGQNLAANNVFFWKSVSAGTYHSCATGFDYKVYCWGYNNRGQLGNGNTGTNQNTPVAVSAGAMPVGAVKSTTVGDYHTCAIASDDKVYCWGRNNYGQLGNGNTGTDQNIPVAVSDGAMPAGPVKSIASNENNTCAIASDDKVYCWGDNYYGQLGNGNTGTDQNIPVAVSDGAMPAGSVKSIAIGESHTCAIASDDKAYCWGYNNKGQLGNGNTGTNQNIPVAVSAGAMPAGTVKAININGRHSCAIASDDKAYCWGSNGYNELGNGGSVDSNIPVAVSVGAMPAGVVKSITAGGEHNCVIASDDKAYCWGNNTSGELGNGIEARQSVPVAVLAGAMPAGAFKSIDSGGSVVCGIASNEKIYCWGYNRNGQLGRGYTDSIQNTPVSVSDGAMPAGAVKSIVLSNNYACAIASDDKVYCWGDNNYGQLGNGNTGTDQNTPVAVSAGAMPAGAVKSITLGATHACAIASNDKVYCWGYNNSGQLGTGTYGIGTDKNTPFAVLNGAMPAGAVKKISAGGSYTCAIASDDKVYCWGSNSSGQLGIGIFGGAIKTSPVVALAGAMPAGVVKSINSSMEHTCAIASDDQAYCWGSNVFGKLGNGNKTNQNTPVAVLVASRPNGVVKSINLLNSGDCVISSDDKVYCWGYNAYGQLGNGNTGTDQNTPVAVLAGATPAGAVKKITTGYGHNCAIASDDKAYCWGYNNYGQLGNGNTGTNQNVPVAVSAGAMPAGPVKLITAGSYHTCTIASDDKVYCWGYNSSGELGSYINSGLLERLPGLVLPPQ